MKRVTFIALLFLTCTAMYSQKYNLAKPPQSKDSTLTLTIEGVDFNGGVSSTGSHYIFRISKKGNEYKQYLGMPTKDLFENKRVYTSGTEGGTKYYFLAIGKTGYPKKVFLTL